MAWGEFNAGELLLLGDWGPWWIAGLALLGAIVVGVSAWDLRDLRPARRRFTLVALRAAVYAIALVMLLEPALELKQVSVIENRIAVLVDVSRSMAIEAEPGRTRADLARRALERVRRMERGAAGRHRFEYYAVGERLEATTAEAVIAQEPSAAGSDLSGALDELSRRYAPGALGGVILISDGIDTGAMGRRTKRGEALDELSARELIGALGAPINTWVAGSPEGIKDLAIGRVVRDDFALVRNKVRVGIVVEATGLGAISVPVELWRDGELVAKREAKFGGGDRERVEVEFSIVPERIGTELWGVRLPELAGEAVRENNRAYFALEVIRDKVRVLQVVGRPSWDERFLREHLKRNPSVDLISFFILRTNESSDEVPTEELSLIPFPTEELFEQELGSFDLVIFQNFGLGPYNMRRYLPRIEEFILNGGGFAMIGGAQSFSSGGYARTPLERALPVELGAGRGQSAIAPEPFRPALTERGARHPITQLVFDPAENAALWAALPAQRGANVVAGLREGAGALLVHPERRAGADPMPILSVGEHGVGRVMALGTDSSWRWGFERLGDGGTAREYRSFWENAVRWLIQDPALKLLRLEAPGAEELGTAAVSIFEPDYTPAAGVEGTLEIERRALGSIFGTSSEVSVERATFRTGADGRAALLWEAERPGLYRLRAEAELEAMGALADEAVALIAPGGAELAAISPRDDLMRAIAEASGGRFAALERGEPQAPALLEPSAERVRRRQVIGIWDSAIAFLLVLALLGADWILRKRWGRAI